MEARERALARLRPIAAEDFDGIVALADARADRMGSPTRTTREGWKAWWKGAEERLFQDSCVAVDSADRIVGIAMVDPPAEPFVVVFVAASVHPDAWDFEALWDDLCRWAAARASAYLSLAPGDAEVSLMAEAVEGDVQRTAALGRAGFERVRIFYRMRADLGEPASAPTLPGGIAIRRMDHERDLLEVAAAHVEAFRDHWGHADQSAEAFAQKWRDDTRDQRTDLSFVAIADGAIAGYVLCEDNYRGDPTTAFVSFVGVRPAWRRSGIALALLQTAFQAFRGEGFLAARLGVDAASPTGAVRLYEKAGMRVVEQVNRYERVLRPGKDLRGRAAH